MKKLTYNFIKEQIEKEGYILLSKEYSNSNSYLELKCPVGHFWKVRWNAFKQGQRCGICCSCNKKLTFEFIKKNIENVKGYELLSKEYINAYSKLNIKCPKGHLYKVKWNKWQQGYRCLICKYEKISLKLKHSYEFVKENIENEGYKLLSKMYKNNSSYLEVKCPKDHIYKVKFNSFQQGSRCPICFGNKKLTFEFVKNHIENEGYKLISKKYIDTHSKLNIKCNKGHIYKSIYNSFQQGHRCPICDYKKKSSKPEKEIQEFCSDLIPIVKNDRTQILNPLTGYNLELDVWIPSLKKAIEFNGTYWHSLPDRKEKDFIKQQQCKEKNINLLVIEEKNWLNDKQQCLKEIKNFIGEK